MFGRVSRIPSKAKEELIGLKLNTGGLMPFEGLIQEVKIHDFINDKGKSFSYLEMYCYDDQGCKIIRLPIYDGLISTAMKPTMKLFYGDSRILWEGLFGGD